MAEGIALLPMVRYVTLPPHTSMLVEMDIVRPKSKHSNSGSRASGMFDVRSSRQVREGQILLEMTTGNLLLDALSPDLRRAVMEMCRPVNLPIRTLLHEQGEMPVFGYFLCSGVASMVVSMAEGGSAEVGLIGREGVIGAMHLLGPTPTPAQCFVQMEGTGLKLKLADLRTMFQTSVEFRGRVLEFVQQQSVTLEQVAACNKLHETEERLAAVAVDVARPCRPGHDDDDAGVSGGHAGDAADDGDAGGGVAAAAGVDRLQTWEGDGTRPGGAGAGCLRLLWGDERSADEPVQVKGVGVWGSGGWHGWRVYTFGLRCGPMQVRQSEGFLAGTEGPAPVMLYGRELVANRRMPLNLDWVEEIQVNTSAVERRAGVVGWKTQCEEGLAGGVAAAGDCLYGSDDVERG